VKFLVHTFSIVPSTCILFYQDLYVFNFNKTNKIYRTFHDWDCSLYFKVGVSYLSLFFVVFSMFFIYFFILFYSTQPSSAATHANSDLSEDAKIEPRNVSIVRHSHTLS
jgi:hypothetical protein